jgi:hypothetical protein
MESSGDLAGSIRKLVAEGAVGDGNAVVDGGPGRPWLQSGLKTEILQQRRFGEISP